MHEVGSGDAASVVVNHVVLSVELHVFRLDRCKDLEAQRDRVCVESVQRMTGR